MNLRVVRQKIKSVGNVKKITKAMQLVSAVKMRKAQAAAVEGRPYREGLEEIISRVVGSIDTTTSPLASSADNAAQRDLIIFVSSNKGLCGSFHLSLQRHLLRNTDYKNADFITIGKKGAMFVGGLKQKILADFSGPTPVVEVSAVFRMALENFLAGNYRKVLLVYNRFISTLRSETVTEPLLPLQIEKTQESKTETSTNYLIEPMNEELIDSLLRSVVEEKIRGAIISSEAVEHSSRMIAMKNATDNATEVIGSLTLLGNKLRQTKITNELLDMVTAKESVETNAS